MKPLAIDLFCGLGGWTEGLLAEGYYVVGFDNHRHIYGEHQYPAQLVVQDVLTLHGSQFKDAALIVASPPCQEYSYMAMPWKIAKQRAADYRSGARDVRELTKLFDSCFRIQREASGAAGHHIPLVVENVRGAIPWVGRSRWNFGSFHLWGDVPALMPMTQKRGQKVPGFRFDGSGKSFQTANADGTKVGGLDWSKYGKPDYKTSGAAGCFRDSAIKNAGGSWFNVAHNKTSGKRHNPARDPMWERGFNATAADMLDGVKCGGDWFGPGEHASAMRRMSSRSSKRNLASAMIAKIPLPLARHIGRTYHP
jgi:C-5 cytosine-specific DNA methylase